MNVGDGRNEGLEIDIPSDKIVKKGKTYPFIVNVGEEVKYVNVYIYGQDNVYYKKVSKGKVSFDFDLSGVSGEVRVKITAYDEEYKNRSIDTKLEVKH
jgi:SHS2 domain-containing protein